MPGAAPRQMDRLGKISSVLYDLDTGHLVITRITYRTVLVQYGITDKDEISHADNKIGCQSDPKIMVCHSKLKTQTLRGAGDQQLRNYIVAEPGDRCCLSCIVDTTMSSKPNHIRSNDKAPYDPGPVHII